MIFSPAAAVRLCVVSYVDHRQIRHAAEVRPRACAEAAVVAIEAVSRRPWLRKNRTVDSPGRVEVREPGTRHAISLQQVERWLAGAATNPNEASKKAKLKVLLMRR